MLRNLNRRTGGRRVLGIRRIGKRGDSLPATGTHGPSAGYGALSLPADAAKLVRFEVTAAPASGVLTMWEDTSFLLVGAADGTYTLQGNQYHDNVLIGAITHNITVGSGTTIPAGVGNAVASGAAANIVMPTNVAAGVGNAAAQGLAAAISNGRYVNAGLGNVVAAGMPAAVSFVQVISCQPGNAGAEGLAASILNSSDVLYPLAGRSEYYPLAGRI